MRVTHACSSRHVCYHGLISRPVTICQVLDGLISRLVTIAMKLKKIEAARHTNRYYPC